MSLCTDTHHSLSLFCFAILVAGGGAPGDCDFGVGGDVCLHSCTDTKPNIDPSRDPDYKEFKDLYQCIESKCVIQLGACQANEECNKCCKWYTPTNSVRNNVFYFSQQY